MKHLLATTALLLATSAALHAQSADFDPHGYVSLNYTKFSGSSSGNTYLLADGGFHWGFGGAVGLDFDLYGVATDDGSTEAAYLALTYDFGDFRLSAGKPRAAFDSFGRLEYNRYAPILAVETALLMKSSATYIDLIDDASSYGLRLDGASGQGTYAVSLHKYDEDDRVYTISGGAAFTLASDVRLTGGFDYTDTPSGSLSKAEFGLAKDFDQIELAFNAVWFDGPSASVSGHYAEIAGRYNFGDQFSAGALLARSAVGSSDNSLYGVDARYTFVPGASAYGAMVGYFDGGGEQYTVGLRYDF